MGALSALSPAHISRDCRQAISIRDIWCGKVVGRPFRVFLEYSTSRQPFPVSSSQNFHDWKHRTRDRKPNRITLTLLSRITGSRGCPVGMLLTPPVDGPLEPYSNGGYNRVHTGHAVGALETGESKRCGQAHHGTQALYQQICVKWTAHAPAPTHFRVRRSRRSLRLWQQTRSSSRCFHARGKNRIETPRRASSNPTPSS